MNKVDQAAHTLREQITSGQLAPGVPIPSEHELVASLGLSRGTIRSALSQLRAEGWIVSYHGKGSFVRTATDRPAHTHTRALTHDDHGQWTDAATAGWHPTEEPGTYRANATADLALTLGIGEHAPLFVHDRLLEDQGGRRQSHRLYIPLSVAATIPALEEDPFVTPERLYAVLADAGRGPQVTDYLRARVPTPDDAGTLRITPGELMLIIRRLVRDDTGTVVALEETRLSAQDTQVEIPITPTRATADA